MKPEILSPAGSFESLVAAVRSGADAVYLGATAFSARRNAENFDKDGLKSAVEYCHIRGVKLYLTLNIMVKNSELSDALSLAGFANEIGIDGLIIEDLGLSSVIARRFPDLPLHASTQMTIHEASCLPLLKEMGFSRVVIAREMSKNEIKEFCKAAAKCGIEVEAFVHGALCMCVSGQCLLSSVLGSRSGNRGLCAGPCRLPFAAEGGTGYDLSLKDLSLLDEIKEMNALGVKSFKIEGRMKRPEYVAAATTAARQMADKGFIDEALKPYLGGVFSRSGFTKGYYENRLGRDMFGIRTKDDVLSSADSLSALHELYRTERQTIALNITAEIKENKPILLKLSDGENTVAATGEEPQKAKRKPIDLSDVKSLLSKLGGTPYFAEDIDVSLGENLFVPASIINALRRSAVEQLSLKRSAPPVRRREEFAPVVNNSDHIEKNIVARFRNLDQIPENLSGITAVALPLECDFSGLPQNIIKIADMPRYILNTAAVIKDLKRAKAQGTEYALCGNISSVQIAKSEGFKIIGDIGLNIANDTTAKVFEDMGVSAVLSSCELTLSETESLNSPLKKGIFAYGRLPLMLTRNCPVKNGTTCDKCKKSGFLKDRKGLLFPVRCRTGYSEVFNSAPVYLADKRDDIKGVDFLLLSFVDESREEAARIIREYSFGGTPPKTFTRGLYYKGVK